jgi:hypothetical protein
MRALKYFAVALVMGIVGFGGLELGERLMGPGEPALVAPAEAIIGRPLTPVSYAGVARRTVRRCAVGVYNC